MTAGERLIEQGRPYGERNPLLRMARNRFGTAVDAAAEQRIMAASSEQLERWEDRVFSAATLTECFAD